jgi:hypothetical protein
MWMWTVLNDGVTWDPVNRMVLFWRGWPSQWHPSQFTDETGTTFNCAEQYMMYHKAKTFNDQAMMKAIMQERKPRKMKELGRKVGGNVKDGGGFDFKKWDEAKDAIVEEASYLKHSQNQELKAELKATRGLTLVEVRGRDVPESSREQPCIIAP